MQSNIQKDTEECYLCGTTKWLEWHHVFGAADRDKSTKYGMVVRLCHFCHNEPPYGVHHNRERRVLLKMIAQKRFEEIWGHEKFMEEFGRNWL